MADSLRAEEPFRLSDLLASLSLAIDLGMGQSMEWGMNACLIGIHMGKLLGLPKPELSAVYYVTLLRHVGCTSTSDLEAHLLGDELAARRIFPALRDDSRLAGNLGQILTHLGDDRPWGERLQVVAGFLSGVWKMPMAELSARHCEIAERVASQLGLGALVQNGLRHAYERWDGRGFPDGLRGEAIPVASHIASISIDLAYLVSKYGRGPALALLGERGGRLYPPELVELVINNADQLLAGGKTGDMGCDIRDAEPEPVCRLTNSDIDKALFVIGDFSDLRSAWFAGYSRRVADLAVKAASGHLEPDRLEVLRRAALVHGLGRVGVSSVIWGKPGRLTAAEIERVRMWPLMTERILSRSNSTRPWGTLASQCMERLDGTGYPKGMKSAQLDLPSRILAASCVMVSLTSDRSHRKAFSASEARGQILAEVVEGRLDSLAVQLVLQAFGLPSEVPDHRPFRLTPREIDVLRLVARGMSNKEMAIKLKLSPKTVGHHLERLYGKIEVRTRSGATLFAVQKGLVHPPG